MSLEYFVYTQHRLLGEWDCCLAKLKLIHTHTQLKFKYVAEKNIKKRRANIMTPEKNDEENDGNMCARIKVPGSWL